MKKQIKKEEFRIDTVFEACVRRIIREELDRQFTVSGTSLHDAIQRFNMLKPKK